MGIYGGALADEGDGRVQAVRREEDPALVRSAAARLYTAICAYYEASDRGCAGTGLTPEDAATGFTALAEVPSELSPMMVFVRNPVERGADGGMDDACPDVASTMRVFAEIAPRLRDPELLRVTDVKFIAGRLQPRWGGCTHVATATLSLRIPHGSGGATFVPCLELLVGFTPSA